ncbi:MAG: glycosyltransferase family 4 protein [Actinomycetota bacterium]|nr:glycosyltransferase family 4 protein [Actinomycetota bacterium]PLS75791.1 MAG: glycosyltransferase family 1 protein [Actinomycetota bacterium]
MRILELTDTYPPFIGGLERHVQILSRALLARGHQVSVATTAVPGAPAFSDEDGVAVHRITGWSKVLSPFYSAGRPFHPTIPDPGMVRSLQRVLERERPDVVHAHSWNLASYLPLHTPACGRALIVTAHDYGLVCPKKTMMRAGGSLCAGPSLRACVPCAGDQYGMAKGAALATGIALSNPLLRRVDCFTAVSRFVADRLNATVTPLTGKQVEVVSSFVPAGLSEAAAAAPRPEFLPADDGYVLFVGALSPAKGLPVLLDAHRRLSHRVPLVLLGTPHPDTPGDLGPDVVLRTNVPHGEVMAAMHKAAIVVAPSVWPDPLPMTVSEAQLCGTPVIGARSGGIPEQIVDGVTGLIVEPGDVAGLAGAIDALLAAPEQRKAMGAAGLAHARKFEVSSVVEDVESVFSRALAGVRAGRPTPATRPAVEARDARGRP